MDKILLVTFISLFGVLILCFILNKLIRFTITQAATITSLLSIAIVVPYSIVNWGDGTNGTVDGGVFALYLCTPLITTFAYYLIGNGGRSALINKKTKKIHWAPVSILGFFIVLAIVDFSFVAAAQNGFTYEKTDKKGNTHQVNNRFPGEVPNAYHKKEAYYNEYQRRLVAQEQRGWQVNFGFINPPVSKEANVFKVRVLDKDNQPINDAEVTAKFTRSAEKELNDEVKIAMTSPGEYEVPVTFKRVGRWGLELFIRKGDDTYEVVGHTTINCPEEDARCHQFFEERRKEMERRRRGA